MLGMTTFTLVHVAISLIGILAGVVVAFGMLSAKRLNAWNTVFLVFTVLTSVTGIMFPYHGVTPGIVLAIISLVDLAIAIFALYSRRLVGIWRSIYVITAMVAFYFNVFVLIAQLFQKVPALNALAPKGSEPPFAISQLCCLILFVVLTIFSVRKFPG